MQKQIGAILLVAGTCIGSGMIALPMVLAKVGLIPALLLMAVIWYTMYYTSLINLELNLQAGHGLSLGALGRTFSGRKAELTGIVSLKLLSYSLLAVFIYGGSSIISELTASEVHDRYSFEGIASLYALLAGLLLLLPVDMIDYCNRFLFVGLLIVIAILLVGLMTAVNLSDLPLFTAEYKDPTAWIALIPVVFTSFGFQVIFHTLTNYCKMDAKMLKKAFLWGSLIPAIVYLFWTGGILSAVYHDNPEFYARMTGGNAEVGELIQTLSGIAHLHSVQLTVWWISLLAIATSVLGVGVGLCESLYKMMPEKISAGGRRVLASIITILPAYLIVIYVPNAFIAVLGFAGMILAVIAVLLPVYLFRRMKTDRLHYPELKNNFLILASVGIALIVIACEVFNML